MTISDKLTPTSKLVGNPSVAKVPGVYAEGAIKLAELGFESATKLIFKYIGLRKNKFYFVGFLLRDAEFEYEDAMEVYEFLDAWTELHE